MQRIALVALLVTVACAREEAPPPVDAGPEPGSLAWKIQTARSAAPWQVSAGAMVVEMAGDSMVTLEAGTTGWTCMVDDPRTPGPDPMCADSVFMAWADAYLANRAPAIATMGVAYMLQGGQVASDTDPAMAAPAAGAAWLEDPPHLMVVHPNPRAAFTGLPTTRTAGAPWVMWAGTPYAHLMVPGAAPAPPAPATPAPN